MSWFNRIRKALTEPVQSSSPFVEEAMCNFTPRTQQVLNPFPTRSRKATARRGSWGDKFPALASLFLLGKI
jgi:hypothetical protein